LLPIISSEHLKSSHIITTPVVFLIQEDGNSPEGTPEREARGGQPVIAQPVSGGGNVSIPLGGGVGDQLSEKTLLAGGQGTIPQAYGGEYEAY